MTPPPDTPDNESVDRRRLHPVTLLQRFILSLPGFAAVLLATYRSPDSTNVASLVATALYAVVALPLIYLRYARFRYWITERELVIQSGVLTRQHRSIPLEKIQNVSIVQRLIPRLTRTASVQVVTAGSTSAEGVLEFVSLEEAGRIRAIVRAFKRGGADAVELGAPENTVGDLAAAESGIDAPNVGTTLFVMTPGRVLLSGAFRFSLLYIAIIFSLIQFFQPDPEALTRWLLQERYAGFIADVRDHPWTAAVIGITSAALLSWLSGIAVNVNKFHRFRLWLDGDKLSKRAGLLTISERSIPRRRIQAVILGSNPLMKRFDWWIARVQTIGHDISSQGHAVLAPFARWDEVGALRPHLTDAEIPESFQHVSSRRIGRLSIRYLLALAVAAGVLSTIWTRWWLVLLAGPVLILVAVLQWRAHGFAIGERGLAVRRGLVKKRIWILPYSKMQVFYTMQSIFQRRRDLKSVYVDTAGASGVSTATIYDIRSGDADAIISAVYNRFIDQSQRTPVPVSEQHRGPDTVPPESSSFSQGPEDQEPSSQ